MKTIAVSGYFSVIHKGHVEMFKKASELGSLIVIVNNNKQQIAKKGALIMPAEDICKIINEFECVDNTIIAIDKDLTVCKTLVELDPNIFANGGDRKKGNVPEYKTCKNNDIEMVFGIGGKKIESSTNIIDYSNNARIVKIIQRIKDNLPKGSREDEGADFNLKQCHLMLQGEIMNLGGSHL